MKRRWQHKDGGLAVLCLAMTGAACTAQHPAQHASATGDRHAPWRFVDDQGVILSAGGRRISGIQVADVAHGWHGEPCAPDRDCLAAPDAPADAATLQIPAGALLATIRGDFVYVVNGDHYLRWPVRTGRRCDRHVEVVAGLFAGDRVVTAGLDFLWLVELQASNGGAACTDAH
jgi:hypothetical protein